MVRVRVEQAFADLRDAIGDAVRRSQDFFLRTQSRDGYWWGELESNPTMEAEYLLMTHFLGVGDGGTWRKLAAHLSRAQRDDGTWGQYYGAPGDLSTTIECYFALKLAGVSAEEPRMARARAFILSKGGIARARVFTRVWLALFGQWPWNRVPTLPPEMALLPSWAPLNVYDFASWARGTMLPLSIVFAARPVCPVPEHATVPELVAEPQDCAGAAAGGGLWRRLGVEGLFGAADWVMRHYHALPWSPLRRLAVRRALFWILERQEDDGSWGGIQPPWVYSLIALHTLGFPIDHPVMQRGLRGFRGFAIEEDGALRVQACVSPSWDTCLAMIALQDSGLAPDHPALQRAAAWLLRMQGDTGGDWQVKAPNTPPGGWAFELCNRTYPDIDDTAEILIALARTRLDDEAARREAMTRGVSWILGVQSGNGGWAAFDKDNTRAAVAWFPCADFGEMIDPPSADVTAHVVEALARLGYSSALEPLRRALDYLWGEQEPAGPWFGRWGVNYIYGAGAVLPALEAAGEDMRALPVRRAVAWLLHRQNDDGGWGETCASYADHALAGVGCSTASQTAWALMGLMAAGEWENAAVHRGFRYLADTQSPDGSWDEPWFTGTGFPGYGVGQRTKAQEQGEAAQGLELSAGFMIKYHLYRVYWPLMALGRYHRYLERGVTRSTAP